MAELGSINSRVPPLFKYSYVIISLSQLEINFSFAPPRLRCYYDATSVIGNTDSRLLTLAADNKFAGK